MENTDVLIAPVEISGKIFASLCCERTSVILWERDYGLPYIVLSSNFLIFLWIFLLDKNCHENEKLHKIFSYYQQLLNSIGNIILAGFFHLSIPPIL
jgi:hypothetical protein